MSEIVIAIFPTEGKAQEAAQQLSDTAAQDDIDVRGAVLLVRAADGTLSEKKWTNRVPWKAPSGAVVGALIGALGGPMGAGVGFASGGAIGIVSAASDAGRVEAKLEEARTKLSSGTSALVVELDERSLQTFSTRVEELGGEIVSPGLKAASE